MFTGIVQGKCQVNAVERRAGLCHLQIKFQRQAVENLQIGASVAINGCCLTVTRIEQDLVYFDLMMETLNTTALNQIEVGDWVNFERSARVGDEIGGHTLSGHVHDNGEVVAIEQPQNNYIIWFQVAPKWMKFIFEKGFIGIDGCSLTVGEIKDNRFSVYLIPETLRVTRFKQLQVGDRVNIEIDHTTQVIVSSLEKMIQSNGFKNFLDNIDGPS